MGKIKNKSYILIHLGTALFGDVLIFYGTEKVDLVRFLHD